MVSGELVSSPPCPLKGVNRNFSITFYKTSLVLDDSVYTLQGARGEVRG